MGGGRILRVLVVVCYNLIMTQTIYSYYMKKKHPKLQNHSRVQIKYLCSLQCKSLKRFVNAFLLAAEVCLGKKNERNNRSVLQMRSSNQYCFISTFKAVVTLSVAEITKGNVLPPPAKSDSIGSLPTITNCLTQGQSNFRK